MAFTIPNGNVNIQPLALPDNAASLAAITQNALRQAQVQRRTGGGGGGATRPKGDYIAVPDASTPEGYRLQWVPGGTEKSRAANLEVIQQAQARQAIASDPIIREKLDKLDNADVATQGRILQDIRRNDIGRISQALGTDAGPLVDAVLGSAEEKIAQRRADVRSSGGISAAWDSLKLGARGLSDMIGAIGESSSERLARAEDYNRYREDILANNAFLQDQELRRAGGEGPFRRLTGDTGSIIGGVGSAVGELLPTAGAIIGAASGGARAGAALGSLVPGVGTGIGALVGGIATGAGAGAITETQAFANRVAADPNLTREQKVQAIDSGLAGAAAVGGVTGAIPLNVGRIGSVAGNALTRAGFGATGRAAAAAGSQEAATAILQQAARDQAARVAARGGLNRFARATGLSAAELSAMNAVGIVGQNAVFNQATGQNVPLTEGLSEGLQQGLLAAPIFAIPRTGRRGQVPEGYDSSGRRIENMQPGESATPSQTGTTQTEAAPVQSIAAREFNQSFRRGLRERLNNGEVLDAQAVRDAYVRDGRTEADFRAWLDTDSKVIESARLGDDVVNRLRASVGEPAQTTPAPVITDREQALYTTMRRVVRGDLESATQAADAYINAGGSIEALAKFITDSAKNKKARAQDATTLSPGFLNKSQRALLAEAVDNIRGGERNVAELTRPDGVRADDGSGGTRETAVLGRDVGGREAAVDNANSLSDSRVATDTGAITEAAAGRVPADVLGGNRAVESGGFSGSAEPNVGAGQAPDVSTQAAGIGTGEGANAGRGVEPAAAVVPEAGPGARSVVGEGVGSASGAGDAATPGPRRVRVDSEGAGRALEETGTTPNDLVVNEQFRLAGETPIPEGPTASRGLQPGEAVAAINALTPEVLANFTPKMRRPTSELAAEASRYKALDVLVKDALGEKLSVLERRQLKALQDAGIPELELPVTIQQEVADARMMGMDVTAREIAESGIRTESTLDKVINRIWCGAV